MKSFSVALLLFAVLRTGNVAPDFKLTAANGQKVSLASLRGHKVVLVFYRGYW